eukprot:5390082-Prymnesium_polylepis.1
MKSTCPGVKFASMADSLEAAGKRSPIRCGVSLQLSGERRPLSAACTYWDGGARRTRLRPDICASRFCWPSKCILYAVCTEPSRRLAWAAVCCPAVMATANERIAAAAAPSLLNCGRQRSERRSPSPWTVSRSMTPYIEEFGRAMSFSTLPQPASDPADSYHTTPSRIRCTRAEQTPRTRSQLGASSERNKAIVHGSHQA